MTPGPTGPPLPKAAPGGAAGRISGLVWVALLAAASIAVAPRVPGVNAVVVGLLVGLVVANSPLRDRLVDDASVTFVTHRVLRFTVVLLGASIDLRLLGEVGVAGIAVIVVAILVGLSMAWFVGGRLGLETRSRLLIGVGTAICGASAIAAVAPLLRAKKEQIGVALATIFAFNALALVAYPVVGRVLDMSAVAYGTWAGVGVHDTAAAVAAGFIHGPEAGAVATLVKLTRTLFLIPLMMALVPIAERWSEEAPPTRRRLPPIPWFILGFLLLATLNTLGWIDWGRQAAASVAGALIVGVVVAVGLTLHVRSIARLGRPLFLTGLIASATVGLVALGLVHLLGW